MRTGAIFARGGCRALKCMALLGMVLALGTAHAAAQNPPRSVTVDAITGDGFTVKWTPPTSGTGTLSGYEVRHTPTSAVSWTVIQSLAISAREQAVTGLTADTTYQVQVRATYTSPAGTSSWVPNSLTATPRTAPGTITPTIEAVDKGAKLTWAADTAARSYEYRYYVTTDGVASAKTATTTRLTVTITGLTPKKGYTFQVRGVNRGVKGEWSTADTLDVATTPSAPRGLVVTKVGTGTSVTLDWVAPEDTGGSAITGYDYRVNDNAWEAVAGSGATTVQHTVTGLDADADYTFQIRAKNAIGPGAAAGSGGGGTGPTTTLTGEMGQITEFKLVGAVEDKTIAGVKRHHVPEGSQGVELSVTVQWTHEEIAAIDYNTPQSIDVEIMSDRGTRALPNWLSWMDEDGQDVHFPRTAGLTGTVVVRTPRASEIPDAQKDSPRHVMSRTGTLEVLILHDNHEAENDAFYIMATGGDVGLEETRGATSRTTLDVVIEDDEDQTVRIRNSKYRGAPTNVYEPAGDPEITNPVFHVDAQPNRNDLPLEVRLDMVDLNDQTVSAAKISLSKAAMTLNDGTIGDSDSVTVHLPASDGDRVDDGYKLTASVNVYSVATGGYETIPVTEHAITVIDRHKLPDLAVSPATATVKEGGKTELTLTINRNPSDTFVGAPAINSSDKEKRQYTDEEISIMLDMGAGSTAGASDFSVMTNPVTFPERKSGSYTASMKVEIEAMADDVLDDMEMLVLDAMVAGKETRNGADKDMHAGVSTLTIEEGTTKLVYSKTDEEIQAVIYAAKEAGMGADMMFNPGETIEIESAGALFNYAEGVTLSYSAMSDNDDVAMASLSGAMVTVTAGDTPGVMAHVTITAHASMPAGAKGLPQTDPGEASVIFPVEVGLAALSIALSGPDDMNLVEGSMGGMVTATANRMVTADTKVTLMRDRSQSSADDMDFEAEPITILAGQMSGSTMVMAVEDDMMEDMEELVLYGMTEGMEGEVTGEAKFYLWDAAVPALPIIAQLLLAAFLAVGGYRRYRRL